MSYNDLKDCKIITAFITPFHEDGSINFDALPDLIEHLLAHHTDGILLAGTTAESPTLTHDCGCSKDCQWSSSFDRWCRNQ